MKKYLIRSGVEPGKQYSLKDVANGAVNVGGNTGNLLFINAVAESLRTSDDVLYCPDGYKNTYSDEEIEKINQEFDGFILPLADFFREDQVQNILSLAQVIKKLTIPCVVVGVGLRAPYEYDITTDRSFDSAVKEFVSAILDKSQCVGVRGERTAAYLNKLGFAEDNYMVIGCPSMCMSASGNGIQIKKIPSYLDVAKFGIITNDLAPDYVNNILAEFIRHNDDTQIIVQRTTEIFDIYFGTLANWATKFSKRKPGSVYGKTLYKELLKANRIHAFANINQWRKYVNRLDICLNERFHGTVASILAGIPSVIIPIDSRTRELVEYHKLPNIRPEMIRGGSAEDLYGLIEKVDFDTYRTVAQDRLERYFDFLELNGLDHVARSYVPRYMEDYETDLSDECWRNQNLLEKSRRNVEFASLLIKKLV